MPRLSKIFMPWKWFGAEKAQPDLCEATNVAAGTKRKRDDLDEEEEVESSVSKRSRLSQQSLEAHNQESKAKMDSSSNPNSAFWTGDKVRRWGTKEGRQRQRQPTATEVDDRDSSVTGTDSHAQQLQGELQSQETPSPQKRSMPPPPIPAKRRRVQRVSDLSSVSHYGDNEVDNTGNESVAGTEATKRTEMDDYSMERARRYAAASKLPDNTGAWASSEKALYFHLSMRGFEALLPQHWMVDFKTLPITLFEKPEDLEPPLIQVQSRKDFRAIHALRNLIETGKLVRDKSLSSPTSSIERKLERCVKDYFAWAIADSSFNTESNDYIPNYVIMTRRKHQTTADAIKHLNTKLRKLAARHCSRLEVDDETLLEDIPLPTPDASAGGTNPTVVFDDTAPKPESASSTPPTLYGLLIISTILVVFTLNHHNYRKYGAAEDEQVDIDSTGLHYISRFDFNDASYDVWNAVAVAITAVEARAGLERCEFQKLVRDDGTSVYGGSVKGVRHEVGSIATEREEDVFVDRRAKIRGTGILGRMWFSNSKVVQSIEEDEESILVRKKREMEVDSDPDR
jgi:hypothetical protein